MANDISVLIANLIAAKSKINTKLHALGLTTTNAKLAECATAVEGIEDKGAVQASVEIGKSYTIPKGYHNGSGTVSAVEGEGQYTLQSKTVTPTKVQQNVTNDQGYYGLSSVTVNPIPEKYQDVSGVTAGAEHVLATKSFVDSAGKLTPGEMTNNGAMERTLSVVTKEITIPKGYHNGNGKVNIVTEEKTITPTKSKQTVPATEGKVISSVVVDAIPDLYIDTTLNDGSAASAEHILETKSGYVNGVKVDGSMPDKGKITASINGLDVVSYTIPRGYHNGEGVVSLTNDIAEQLAAI